MRKKRRESQSAGDARNIDRFCRLAARAMGMADAAVFVGDTKQGRQLMGASKGFPKLEAADALWDHLGDADQVICIEDLRDSAAFGRHGWVKAGIRGVVAAPLVADGASEMVGSLILCDGRQASLDAEDLSVLSDLSETARDLLEVQASRQEALDAQERLQKAQKRREELIEELNRSNKKLEQFAYVASHDLQEPLRMVSGFMGLLEDEYRDELDAEAQRYIAFAVDGAQRMKAMIQGLLAYSRMWSRREPYDMVDCAAIVAAAVEEFRDHFPEATIAIDQSALPNLRGRAQQLHQLFLNLLANAHHHGGTTTHVEITAQEREEDFLFAVIDNGQGVPEEQQARIFDIFVSGTSDAESKGSGIGLAICKTIVEEHGGRLWLESSPGEGAAFYFTLKKAS